VLLTPSLMQIRRFSVPRWRVTRCSSDVFLDANQAVSLATLLRDDSCFSHPSCCKPGYSHIAQNQVLRTAEDFATESLIHKGCFKFIEVCFLFRREYFIFILLRSRSFKVVLLKAGVKSICCRKSCIFKAILLRSLLLKSYFTETVVLSNLSCAESCYLKVISLQKL
jgi:hypothetical protein